MKDISSIPEPFSPLPQYASAEANEQLQWAVQNCARRVSESHGLGAEALVLTGSMARGEGSVLQGESGLVCLSDMEFMLAVRDRENSKRCRTAVRELTEQVTEEAASRGLECKFEFAPVSRRYFQTVRPSIFALELSRHGQVVWGDPSLLRMMPTITASSIPKIDALYLVCNRMIEQLAWRVRLCADDCHEPSRLFAYSLVKTYIDLGTSLLIFTGEYESTYAQRAERLDSLRDSVADEIAEFDLLLGKIEANSVLKLQPTQELLAPMPKDVALNHWAELARFVLRVWQWEVRQLDKGASEGQTAEVLHFARSCSLRERFRNWAKLAKLAAVHGHGSDLLRATYLCGAPRNRLYVEATLKYAELAGLESVFPFARSNTKNFLPIRSREELSSEESAAEIVRIWNIYFRNT